MSHELRTPLNGIIGFAEFLSDEKPGPLNPKQKEYLGDILDSGRHLLHLINDLLDLVKVQAGKMEFRPGVLALEAAIGEACAVVQPMAAAKSLRIERNLAAGPSSVTIDPQRFRQVLLNLLSNAVKFTNKGGEIRIETRVTDEAYFELEVRDSGVGIREEDLSRLFVEFAQLDKAGAQRMDGTGLGLALTKRLVELQGGTISVRSRTGEGTTFIVSLPRTAATQ